VLLGLRSFEWHRPVRVDDAIADELDLGIALHPLVPPAKVMTRLDPGGTTLIVEDGNAGLVDDALFIARAQDPFGPSWIERWLSQSSQTIECQGEHDESRDNQGSCTDGSSHPRKGARSSAVSLEYVS
jgi:hypothetical protein